MIKETKAVFLQFIFYNLIGVVNTVFGFSLVFFFIYMGVENILSNFLGYFFGIIVSFFLNKKYTFRQYNMGKKIILGFFMILAVAYVVNAFIFWYLIEYYRFSPYFAQLVSGSVYTILSFIAMKTFLFTEKNKKEKNKYA